MLSKVLSVAFRLFALAPKLAADLESDVSKIKGDKTLASRLVDAADAFAGVLTDLETLL